MMKRIIFLLIATNFAISLNAQIFTQDFSESTDLASYISLTPDSGQLSDIINNASVTSSITNGALRMVKSASASSYFYRNPDPALSPAPKLLQFKFDFEVSNQDGITGNPIFFYFGNNFSATGTALTEFHSRFGISISATSGNFALNVLDNGVTMSADFSGKQTITFIVNNSGNSESYIAPNGTTESIANDKWEIWVGNTKIFNEITSRNPLLELGSFKMQYNTSVPFATLDFDNFEMTELPLALKMQSLLHPHIWVTNNDKQRILDNIAQYSWATNLLNQYKTRVDSKKDSHKINPATIISTIPVLPGNRTDHRNSLTLGFDASLLYWLTGNEDYAQLAADILYYYTKNISQISGNIDFVTPRVSDTYLIESRELYTKPPMIYDFVYAFLKKAGTTVYDEDTGTRVPFNFVQSETTFKNLATNVFNRGLINTNHPVLEAPGALFNLLVIEDDATRNTYFNNFMVGTTYQKGLTWMMNQCKNSGVWPEATGYSIDPQRIILELMEVVDKYSPSLGVVANNQELINTSFFFENYRFPDNTEVMRFGDAHRTNLDTQSLMERVLRTSERKGYTTFKNKSVEILKALYSNNGGYNPTVITQTLEWNNPLHILWGQNFDLTNVTPISYNSSVNIDYAGIAMQRNINTTNRVESGLMGYTGGAHYVHSHCTGIDMEIYGLGTVLGTGGGDVGSQYRDGVEFNNYHRIYAGHNTVIVNGTSKGTSAGAWNYQLFMNKTVTLAAEPASLANPISTEFSFSAQVLDDAVNNAKQQRVFSVIRTSDNTGYYFDLFRSKSLGTNNFHDYVYHNVGDGINMVDGANSPIALTPTTGRYTSIQNGTGGIYYPGWHYFENVNTSNAITAAVKATVVMTKTGTRYMHILMPGGENREYTKCIGPPTIEAQLNYTLDPTPIVTVRHYGEAWNKPFISIFEPSRNLNGSVKSVENLYTGAKIVGAKVTSVVNGNTINDYIISNENDGEGFSYTNPLFTFTGRFGIIRTEVKNGTTDITLYIGKGQQLTFLDQTLNADIAGKAYSKYTLNYVLSTLDHLQFDEHIVAYPNPTQGLFEINVPKNLENIKLEVYNIQAQLIESKTHQVNNGQVGLNISDKTKGIYFVKVNLDKPIYVKVIKH